VNFREKEKQVLDQILGPGRYDARIRPSGINGTGERHTAVTRQRFKILAHVS
jgi:anionic glutamate receptor